MTPRDGALTRRRSASRDTPRRARRTSCRPPHDFGVRPGGPDGRVDPDLVERLVVRADDRNRPRHEAFAQSTAPNLLHVHPHAERSCGDCRTVLECPVSRRMLIEGFAERVIELGQIGCERRALHRIEPRRVLVHRLVEHSRPLVARREDHESVRSGDRRGGGRADHLVAGSAPSESECGKQDEEREKGAELHGGVPFVD